MARELLNAVAVKHAKYEKSGKRLNDGDGLYLLLRPNGAKWWRFDYSFRGKRNTISLGVYPDVGLADARQKANEARSNVANGIDPSEVKKAVKKQLLADELDKERQAAGLPVVGGFEDVTLAWLKSTEHQVRPMTQKKKLSRFERFVFPTIGFMMIEDIKSPDIYALLKPIIEKGQLETAHRVHAEISCVFAYAIAHGMAEYDPAQPVARQIPSQKVQHRAAITDPRKFSQLLRDIYSYQGTFVVQSALKLSPMLFQRPGEIRQMEWKQIDMEANDWRFLVTKTEVQHLVPLPHQAVAILEEIKQLTGHCRYVFPSSRNDGRPMSDNTIRTALKTLGYDSDVMTAHGFRTTASTLLNEQGWNRDAIERQLSHMERDPVRAAYNRAQYLDERRRMMQAWADYLDRLKNGADVINIRNGV